VLDVAVLHADRDACRAVETARFGGGEQLRELGLRLHSLCVFGVRRTCSDHVFIIANRVSDFINDFWPPASPAILGGMRRLIAFIRKAPLGVWLFFTAVACVSVYADYRHLQGAQILRPHGH
jgi:hypothetical protein